MAEKVESICKNRVSWSTWLKNVLANNSKAETSLSVNDVMFLKNRWKEGKQAGAVRF